MELVDRYLHAVGNWLPKAQRKDILAELSEDIQSQIEENEAKLARPLNSDEVAAILRQRGEPMAVASRYAPPKPLIGPELLPRYWFVMKLVLFWILIPVHVLIIDPILVMRSSNPALAVLGCLWTLLISVGLSAGIITLVFALVERQRPAAHEWDPRRLPPVRGAKPTPRYVALVEFFTAVVVGLIFVVSFQTNFELNGMRIALSPAFRLMYWPTLFVLLSGIPVGAVSFFLPAAVRLRSAIRLAANLLTLGVVGVLLSWGSWVEISAPMFRAADVAEAERWTNFGILVTLLIIAIVVLFEAIGDLRKLLDRSGGGSLQVAVL